MTPLIRVFFAGMMISFLGTLPLGTLNIAAMQIAIADSIRSGILFAIGCLSVEIVYVRLSLIAMDWVRRQEKLFKVLEWATVVIVLLLAASSFYTALHPSQSKNPVLNSSLHPYILGLLMSAISPVQIPFWFGWSTVLFTKKILLPKNNNYNVYIAGIGIGTFIGHCVFIFGGRLVAGRITNNQVLVNCVIGGIFLITAFVQLWKIYNKKDPHHDLEHPEEMTKKFSDQFDNLQQP